MPDKIFYRGGGSLAPTPHDVRLDPATGLLRTTHGVSVFDRPDNLERFGGAYCVETLLGSLVIVQRGRDPHHHEIVPAHPMSLGDYKVALAQVRLVPAIAGA